MIKKKTHKRNANLLQTYKDLLHFKGNQCTDLTDSYSLAAPRNKYNNNDIAQMSFNQL